MRFNATKPYTHVVVVFVRKAFGVVPPRPPDDTSLGNLGTWEIFVEMVVGRITSGGCRKSVQRLEVTHGATAAVRNRRLSESALAR